MTNNNQPITPPPKLVAQWFIEGPHQDCCSSTDYAIAQAARWGYEQRGADIEYELQKARDEELEACCEHLQRSMSPRATIDYLRAARRPKPKSLAEEGYDALDTYIYGNPDSGDKERTYNALRRALERLQELEGQANG